MQTCTLEHGIQSFGSFLGMISSRLLTSLVQSITKYSEFPRSQNLRVHVSKGTCSHDQISHNQQVQGVQRPPDEDYNNDRHNNSEQIIVLVIVIVLLWMLERAEVMRKQVKPMLKARSPAPASCLPSSCRRSPPVRPSAANSAKHTGSRSRSTFNQLSRFVRALCFQLDS